MAGRYRKDCRHQLARLPGRPLIRHWARYKSWLRDCCAVPLGIPHSTQQEAQLCGYTIPCETVVICNHQAVHLNETSWNNPCEFDPERFLDEDCEQPRLLRCISNFLPFGLGPCV